MPNAQHSMWRRHHSALRLLVCALPVLTGCDGRPERAHAAAPALAASSTSRATTDTAQPGAAASGLKPGSQVPDVPLTLQDGFQLQLPAMKGKLIAAFFCASLDDPQCQREAQVLAEHYSELHEEHHVVIVGVTPASAAAHKAFLANGQMAFDFASDPDGQVARAFGVEPLETFQMVVVDRQARIHALWRGADPEKHVRDLLVAAR